MRGPARHGYPRCCLTYATEALAPRVATEADADLVTRVLVDAFRGDPMWGTRAFPKRRGRRANRHVVFRTFVAGALRYPATWVTPGDAVAMWTPPGGAGLTTEQEVQLEADLRARVGVDEARRIFETLDMFVAMEPAEPHYYLSLLGTDPASPAVGTASAYSPTTSPPSTRRARRPTWTVPTNWRRCTRDSDSVSPGRSSCRTGHGPTACGALQWVVRSVERGGCRRRVPESAQIAAGCL